MRILILYIGGIPLRSGRGTRSLSPLLDSLEPPVLVMGAQKKLPIHQKRLDYCIPLRKDVSSFALQSWSRAQLPL